MSRPMQPSFAIHIQRAARYLIKDPFLLFLGPVAEKRQPHDPGPWGALNLPTLGGIKQRGDLSDGRGKNQVGVLTI